MWPNYFTVEVFACKSKYCTRHNVGILNNQIRFLNTEICKKLCIFTKVICLLCNCSLISHGLFRLLAEYTICREKATLSQEQIQEVKNCVLKKFPINYTEEVTFHFYYFVVAIRIVSCWVQTVGWRILHLNKFCRNKKWCKSSELTVEFLTLPRCI